MNSLRDKLLSAFRVEHKDHLEAARSMLDASEASSWAIQSLDLVELHRRLHSLKGAARAVDMRPVEALAHSLESMIEDCQSRKLEIDDTFARTVRDALDAIEDWVDAAMAGRPLPIIDDASRRIAMYRGDESGSTAAIEELETNDGRNAPEGGPKGDYLTAPPAELLRVEARKFEALMQCASEILAVGQEQDGLSSDLGAVRNFAEALQRDFSPLRLEGGERGATPGANAKRSGRGNDVPAHLQQIARLLNSTVRRQRSYAWRMRQLGRGLQSQIQSLRMISAEAVFGGARKVVRDIAHDEGKIVSLNVRGLETLADRLVLQSLKDPVLHILRNAVHHGIEAPAERVDAGKPDSGAISLEVSSRGRDICVRIEDDGRGVDRIKVAAAARKKGLLPGGAEVTDETLASVLCLPGLTTAEQVTEVAGRGIGLSVVKDAVARLGGDLLIEERGTCGVSVQIKAPASILAKRFIFVTAVEAAYCVAANKVRRIHKVDRNRIESIDGRPHLIFCDSPPVALAPLACLLSAEDEQPRTDWEQAAVMELVGANPPFGVIVDSVLGVWDGFVRDLGLYENAGDLIAGGVVLENGIVAPVLDASALVQAYKKEKRKFAIPTKSDNQKDRVASILVVDDSITTRTLEKSVLEASGYQVRLSVDGADALRQLRQEPADLVISDIEMPNLDGFALVRAMKQDVELLRIPVILVTSRGDDEDKRRGLELGADAYVVKQRFDQAELLSIIDRLL